MNFIYIYILILYIYIYIYKFKQFLRDFPMIHKIMSYVSYIITYSKKS